ncbi:MAG: twitching motility protein PilJ [Candidatus Azotimanducaceae bacterium]|jgi:twitching motility protein PilJ
MAKSSVVGKTMRRPVILIMSVLLITLIAAFAGNFYLAQQKGVQGQSQLAAAGELKALSESIAKNAVAAANGQLAAFPMLSDNKSSFATQLGFLQRSDTTGAAKSALASVAPLWAVTEESVNILLANRESIGYLKDITGDLSINMSAIQQENNRVVAGLLRLGVPPNQIALAQRQNLLIERMLRSVDKISEFGAAKNLVDNLKRDSQTFEAVLKGLKSGDRDLLLTAVGDASIQANLAQAESLFRTVATQLGEIEARADSITSVQQAANTVFVGSTDFLEALTRVNTALSETDVLDIASPFVGLVAAMGAFVIIFLISLLIYRQANQNVSETEVQNEQNQSAILQLLDELADLADGDLRVQATVTESFTGAIADSINFSIDQLRSLVSQINETSGAVSTAADQTQKSVNQLSEAAKRQAEEISQVSDAVNDMAVSIDQVSYNAAESSSVAERSVEIANNGASVVQNTIDGMDNIRGQIQETAKRIKRLGESSQEIGDIVSLINDIADQTNILSLNAAIQASMAGDAGKGFAVVADEVQRLAERSGAAAKQISALVKTIQSDTNEAVTSMEQTTSEVVRGTRLAQDAGVALGEIESVSSSLAEIIENISDAARQQAASAGKISNTMKSIEEITSQTTEGTQATVVAVGNLAEITNELRASVTGFKLPS